MIHHYDTIRKHVFLQAKCPFLGSGKAARAGIVADWDFPQRRRQVGDCFVNICYRIGLEFAWNRIGLLILQTKREILLNLDAQKPRRDGVGAFGSRSRTKTAVDTQKRRVQDSYQFVTSGVAAPCRDPQPVSGRRR